MESTGITHRGKQTERPVTLQLPRLSTETVPRHEQNTGESIVLSGDFNSQRNILSHASSSNSD